MDERELGLPSLGTRALLETWEEIQLHRISLRPMVVLQNPKALISSQYLCGMERPDSSHIVHKVQIRHQHGESRWIQTLIDCGATSIFMSPQLLNRLRLLHKAVHITTHGVDGQVIVHARESRKMATTVQYMDYLAPVHEPKVPVIPMRAYDLVLGLPWFNTRKLEIDWATAWLTPLRTPSGQGEARGSGMIVWWYEGRDDETTNIQLPDIGRSTPTINTTSEIPVDPDGKWRESGEDSPTPDIEILGAIAFDDLLASNETLVTFALQIGECSELLGATMEVTTLEDRGEIETINPKRWMSEQGAAVVVAAEEEPNSGMLEWQLPTRQVTMWGCWTSGVWLIPGCTAWSAGPWFSFPIIFLNSKSEIEDNVQILDQVLYLLIMEVVSLWDTRTMWTCSAKIWQRLWHCTNQLTLQSIWNQTSIYHMAKSTIFRKSSWKPSSPTSN